MTLPSSSMLMGPWSRCWLQTAIAFVLVSVSLTDFYRVPWPVWRDMAEIYGRKYMTHAELSCYEVPATAGFIKFLHGIEEVTV